LPDVSVEVWPGVSSETTGRDAVTKPVTTAMMIKNFFTSGVADKVT
jgi:hypothetical protein